MNTEQIILAGTNYRATLEKTSGKLISFLSFGAEMLSKNAAAQSLMEIRVLDREAGSLRCFTEEGAAIHATFAAQSCRITVEDFPDLPQLRIHVNVSAEEDALIYTTEIENGTPHFIENIACPLVQVPTLLKDDGGDAQIFWARSEGSITGSRKHCIRRSMFFGEGMDALHPVKYNYPGIVTMQYMAFMREAGSLYFAAHDTTGAPKAIAPTIDADTTRLDLRLYPCVEPGTTWLQPYPIVLKPYQGGWEEAADIYRAFLEAGKFPLPPKIVQNKLVPEWVKRSPVVVIYPPRSVRGTGYMGPNEFFPYVNGLKYLDDLSDSLETQLMAFLPYWEGSAPWAAPFSWPPYGGVAPFQEYVDQMHARGNQVGLYCSGLHWTDQHLLVPEYNMTDYRKEHGLDNAMCRLPSGDFTPGICTSIRTGTTMCSQHPSTRQIVREQMAGILSAKVDYIQYFDQHMGGEAFACYADNHDHPACYGPWSTKSMKQLYHDINEQIRDTLGAGGSAIGPEGSAADFFCAEMPISELRGHLGLYVGIPVPAASYVLHEYTSNFMDNQCCFRAAVDRYQNPDTILYSLAYSFTAGDAMTLVMKSGGEIHFDWGQSWLEPGPRQEPVKTFVRRLNALRQGCLNPFLIGGRMLPTPAFTQPGTYSMTRFDGTTATIGEVLSSCWRSQDGKEVQLFTNFREKDIDIQPTASIVSILTEDGDIPWSGSSLRIPALSAVAVRLN